MLYSVRQLQMVESILQKKETFQNQWKCVSFYAILLLLVARGPGIDADFRFYCAKRIDTIPKIVKSKDGSEKKYETG